MNGFVTSKTSISLSQNEHNDPNGPENIIYTIMKYGEMVYGSHMSLDTSCKEVLKDSPLRGLTCQENKRCMDTPPVEITFIQKNLSSFSLWNGSERKNCHRELAFTITVFLWL